MKSTTPRWSWGEARFSGSEVWTASRHRYARLGSSTCLTLSPTSVISFPLWWQRLRACFVFGLLSYLNCCLRGILSSRWQRETLIKIFFPADTWMHHNRWNPTTGSIFDLVHHQQIPYQSFYFRSLEHHLCFSSRASPQASAYHHWWPARLCCKTTSSLSFNIKCSTHFLRSHSTVHLFSYWRSLLVARKEKMTFFQIHGNLLTISYWDKSSKW